MPDQISQKIKYYSFFWSIGVVFFHVCPTPEDSLWCNNSVAYWMCCRVNHFLAHAGTYANIFFIFCSAFLLYRNINKSNIKKKCISRMKTVFIPLIIWNLIYAIPFWVIRGEHFTALDVIFSRCCVPMWFLTVLLVYLLLMPIIELVIFNKLAGATAIIVFWLLNGSFIEKVNMLSIPGGYQQELARYVQFLPVYILGAYVGTYFKELIYSEKYLYYKFVKVINIIALFIPLIGDLMGITSFTLDFIFVCCFWCVTRAELFSEKMPRYVGDSFGIFALHTGIWLVVNTVFIKIGICFSEMRIHFVSYLLFRCLGVLALVIISLVITELLRRIVPKIYKVLYGNRNYQENK